MFDQPPTFPERPARPVRPVRLVWSCLAFVAIAVVSSVRPATAATAPFGPPVVGVMVARKQPVYRHYSYIGRAVSPHIVKLQARVAGYLDRRLFHQGSYVKKGQLLYVIEQGPYKASLDQAKANVSKAQAALTYARLVLARAEKLLPTPAGQQSTVDQDKATVESDAASVASAKAALEAAKINYGYTEIRAPISGRIGATSINVGNVVGPSSGVLATIVSENPIDIVFSVPMHDLAALRASLANDGGLAALALTVRLPNGQVDKRRGKIDFISNQVSESTDTIEIRGSIANPADAQLHGPRSGSGQLTSGESVTVSLRTKEPTRVIVLPRDAVLSDQFGDYVLTVNGKNQVMRQRVSLEMTTPATAAVKRGITPGERVIVDGIEKVHPGIKVDAETVNPKNGQG